MEYFFEKPEFKRRIVNDIFKEDGAIASCTNNYQVRESQKEAAELLAEAVANKQHAVIEGPCGFGKTYVYLSSAILKAMDNKMMYADDISKMPKILIVTNGISLQEQLCSKDLPAMINDIMVGISEKEYGRYLDVKYALFKGRQNFVCPLKFDINSDEIKSRLPEDKFNQLQNCRDMSGDLSRLDFILPQDVAPLCVCQNHNDCKKRKCAYYNECPYVYQKNEAYKADIIVCNYHMLFSSIEAPVLPVSNMIIWDEAHEAAQIFRNFNTDSLSEYWVFRLSSTLHKILDTAYGFSYALKYGGPMFSKNDKNIEEKYMDGFKECVSNYLRRAALVSGINLNSAFEDTKLIHEDTSDTELDILKGELITRMDDVKCFLEQIRNQIVDDLDGGIDFSNDEREEVENCFDMAGEVVEGIDKRFNILKFKSQEGVDYTYYVKKSIARNGTDLYLERMPVQIGPLVKRLFLDTHQNIFTSATLSTGGNLNFFKNEVGLDLGAPHETFEFMGESPFNLPEQELWYLPDICVDGNKQDFDDYFVTTALTLYNVKKGGMLILTTSIGAMNRTRNALAQYIFERGDDTLVLKQGDAPRSQLIEQFKKNGDAILVATKSFFTGIDIPGSALQCLLIDKLPFDPPNDPIVMHLNCTQSNCFFSYSIPKMVITLKQAVGRGVRSIHDKCVVCIADGRMATSRYSGTIGKSFNYKKTATRDINKVAEFFDNI